MREIEQIYGAVALAKEVKKECNDDINEAFWQGMISAFNFVLGE